MIVAVKATASVLFFGLILSLLVGVYFKLDNSLKGWNPYYQGAKL